MENKEKKRDNWIRIASKSRPGRFYMFNKATGDTEWLPLENEGSDKKHKLDSSPILSISKTSKTPAQDRLKRLQHNLKSNQTRSHSSRSTRENNALEDKSKQEQENQTNDQLPSTSAAAKERKVKSARKPTKRSQSEMEKVDNTSKISSTDQAKKLRRSDTFNSIEATAESGELTECNKLVLTNTKEQLQNVEENTSSTLNNLRCGIVKKIKEICKIPFNVSKKIAEEKTNTKEDKSYVLINTNQYKAAKKSKDSKNMNLWAAQEALIINQFREENTSNFYNEIPRKSLEFSTPENLNVPAYPRGSANSRLERLKQSLISQQQKQKQTSNTLSDTETLNEQLNLSFKTNNNRKLLHLEDHNPHNNSTSTLYHTANNTNNDEIEAMDWQPTVKEDETAETSTSENDSTLIIEKSKKLVVPKDDTNEKLTMGDIYDTVNGNLLRFSAEKHNDPRRNQKKWHKDYYYFIVDTNVLLRDLTFVEDLTKMKLCDTNGSILYIPYSVLQELDKLKMRSGLQEGVKTLAVRAIKYLNTKFENNSSHVQAQSAIDERHRLVDINSADDSIINCCLQAKEHIPNLLLLTEDVNLRNKAICNNILVSTKSDLVAKRYDSSVTDDDKS